MVTQCWEKMRFKVLGLQGLQKSREFGWNRSEDLEPQSDSYHFGIFLLSMCI
ncbi:MAG: hypothetical protein H6767_01970 [Candidatus Peribacteria bacterium]|nr:MAG: hypothetical protein H6767_01970 [Candidatus Peribacteria bacterium]